MSSVLVPRSLAPAGRIDTLASQRSDPFSMSQSETAVYRMALFKASRKIRASRGEAISGDVTISRRGTPARFRSIRLSPSFSR